MTTSWRVDAALGVVAHDQRRGEQELLLQPEVRMHPVGAGLRQVEGELGALARRHRWLRQGVAVEPERRRQPVPVNDGRLGAVVTEPRVKTLGTAEVEARPTRLVEDAEDRRCSAPDHDDTRPHRQVTDRRRRPGHPRKGKRAKRRSGEPACHAAQQPAPIDPNL
jgi:hypothetical protein